MRKNLVILVLMAICLCPVHTYGAGAEDYRKAAEQGDAKSQYELGKCYEFGKGVEKDPAKAVEWYRKAAEKGDATGQLAIGLCYEVGKGVEKDPVKAVEWYRKAAEKGGCGKPHDRHHQKPLASEVIGQPAGYR